MFYGSAFILKGYIMKITAVIVAGGKGTRMGADKNKVFLKILGREVLYYTISAFEKNDKIDDIINYKTFYNSIKKTDYNADGYLDGLEIVHKDYRDLIIEFSNLENVIFIYDPPYLSTNSDSYNSVFHWKLNDYMDIIDSLKNINSFFYFTSHRGGLIELLEWMDEKYKIKNPLINAKKVSVKTSAINTVYTDFMFYKHK